MRFSFSVFGFEVVAFEAVKPDQTFVVRVEGEEDEEESEPESEPAIVCWHAEEYADYTVYPPGDSGVRTVFP